MSELEEIVKRRDFLKGVISLAVSMGLPNIILPDAEARQNTNYAKIPAPDVGYEPIVKVVNFNGVELADIYDRHYEQNLFSRIQRTERWRNIIEAVESRYNIPKGIIYAVVMNESYGDPLLPNKAKDGGFGLVHFQPGTAIDYGLDIFGNSKKRGRDHRHGRQLAEMLRDCNYAIKCVLEEDDRAHPIKNLDAIARYLKDGYNRKGTWEGAVQTINPKGKGYANRIFRWRNAAMKFKAAAERDFNERNRGKKVNEHALTFDFYIKSFWNMNRNYGLDKYRQLAKYT